MGMEWSAAGTEALYLKSRVVMAARAAGKRPIGGIWQQVHDLDGLAAFADAERRMGFAGTTILHPSNAPIVNRAFSPGPEQSAQYRAMIASYQRAPAAGLGPVMVGGVATDKAPFETSRAILSTGGPTEPRHE